MYDPPGGSHLDCSLALYQAVFKELGSQRSYIELENLMINSVPSIYLCEPCIDWMNMIFRAYIAGGVELRPHQMSGLNLSVTRVSLENLFFFIIKSLRAL